MSELKRLRELAKDLVAIRAEGGELDGFELFELIKSNGLLQAPVPFNPEKHIDVLCCMEPGDDWYIAKPEYQP